MSTDNKTTKNILQFPTVWGCTSHEVRIVNMTRNRDGEEIPCSNCYCFGYPCLSCETEEINPCVVSFDRIKKYMVINQDMTYEDFVKEERIRSDG